MTLSVTGSYDGKPVSVLLDSGQESSMISSRFALTANIPRTVTYEGRSISLWGSGPIRIPTVSGWYTSRFKMPITYVKEHDIVLGADWFRASGVQTGSCFVRDPVSGDHVFPDGHEWEPSPLAVRVVNRPALHSPGEGSVLPLPSSDDRSRDSSSHGLGSNAQVAATGSPHNVAYAVSVLVPTSMGQNVFHGDASPAFVRSMCVSHNVEGNDLRAMQVSLFLHIVTGACAELCNRYTNGCKQIAGSFEDATSLASSIRDALVKCLQTCSEDMLNCLLSLMSLPLADARSRTGLIEILRQTLVSSCVQPSMTTPADVVAMIESLEDMSTGQLQAIADAHGIQHDGVPAEDLLSLISAHIFTGGCHAASREDRPSGQVACEQFEAVALDEDTLPDSRFSTDDFQIRLLQSIAGSLSRRALRRLLDAHKVEYNLDDSVSKLRRRVNSYVKSLCKGKQVLRTPPQREWNRPRSRERERWHRRQSDIAAERERLLRGVRNEWPRLVSSTLKDKLIRAFRYETSSESLRSFVCACCGVLSLCKDKCTIPFERIPFDILRCPPDILRDTRGRLPLPVLNDDRIPSDVLIEPAGLTRDNTGRVTGMHTCRQCAGDLDRDTPRLPSFALANRTFLGAVPPELKELTFIEEQIVARARGKACIVHLKETSQLDEQDNDEDRNHTRRPNLQRGLKGHIIIHPQRPERLDSVLPPTVSDIVTPICVIFVGAKPPTTEWLKEHARPLVVRREKVRSALLWLKQNNVLYKDLTIDQTRINELPADGLLPVTIEHVLPNAAEDVLTSRYDSSASEQPDNARDAVSGHTGMPESEEGTLVGSATSESSELNYGNYDISRQTADFQKVVITDVDGRAPANELRAAAIRHIKQKSGGYVEVPHGPRPLNEFCNPELFPMLYPSLFPYGIGGCEDPLRSRSISLQRHVKHLLHLVDRRFQEHYAFIFIAFNILQRRTVLLNSSLKVRKETFTRFASDLVAVSEDAVARVCTRIAETGSAHANDAEEHKVLQLMKEVQLITRSVPGSSSARIAMRNEIRALMLSKGMPSFFITINPADTYNPVVRFLAGEDIDVDRILPSQPYDYWKQSILVAKNPVVAATFFNVYMKAFISALLGFDPKDNDRTLEGGILGVVKAYYGCVEAQGRGTLHCHMLVWVEGSLNPSAMKERLRGEDGEQFGQRLIAFLDDTISTSIPPPFDENDREEIRRHKPSKKPLTTRGVELTDSLQGEDLARARRRDLRLLVACCQHHEHTATCFKYQKEGEANPTCRFELDEDNYIPESTVDHETGELTLRCLDGLINNYNATILEAMRCNMDLKFIGTGEDAKAVIYYVTDYITKSQLKTHIAYAALALGVKKATESVSQDTEEALKAKRLLQKCSFALIANQELSAQQVAMYLLGQEDHFTSHTFANLYWPSIERHLDHQLPSPECRYDASVYIPNSDQLVENLTSVQTELSGSSSDEEKVGDPPGSVEMEAMEYTADGELENEGGSQIVDNDFDGLDDDQEDPDDIPGERDSYVEYLDQDDDQESDMEEVIISTDQSGHIVPVSSQVADYIYRGARLSNVCLWDFVAQTKKVRLTNAKRETNDDSDDEESSNDLDCDEDTVRRTSDLVEPIDEHEDILHYVGRRVVNIPFLDTHNESKQKCIKVLQRTKRQIPVPIGPRLPRQDRENERARYSRLMTALFVPWRDVHDLKRSDEDWISALQRHKSGFSPEVLAILENMQLVHECKDSRDDHMRDREKRRHLRQKKGRSDGAEERQYADEDELGIDCSQEEILTHLQSVDASRSDQQMQLHARVLDCIATAEQYQLFRHQGNQIDVHTQLAETNVDELPASSSRLETAWRMEYDNRRTQWKEQLSIDDINRNQNQDTNVEDIPEIAVRSQSDLSHIESADVTQVRIAPAFMPTENRVVDIDSHILRWTLNHEQSRAFRIIAEHSNQVRPDPLRLYIGGFGGTGKSRVIQALTAYFEEKNQARRLRLASYTGIAARNVAGVTLHTALALDQRSSRRPLGSKTRGDLAAMWEGVDYLLIDEVSMVGCKLLAQISEALCDAKGKTDPFGGVSIIVAGDFAQLPPVGETRLYAWVNTRSQARAGRGAGQQVIAGKLLWLSFTKVVMLHEIMRQRGPENTAFVDLLARLRVGQCTAEDYELLRTRVLTENEELLNDPQWADVPIIVYDNATKDALNVKATQAFAQRTGREMHWYYAIDRHRGRRLTDPQLQNHLFDMHSGQTCHRLGKIPLVLGMPVIISQNFDVQGGIVNGSIGVLAKIRYRIDTMSGRRVLTSCVIRLRDVSAKPMFNLEEGYFPVLEDTVDMTFTHPYSGRKIRIRRTQVPIQPAFAMTAHKAQGQTFSRVIIDLESCKGTEAPYVMLSRATTLKGVVILRPFAASKLRCRVSEDLRRENLRLRLLALKTIVQHPRSDRERSQARAQMEAEYSREAIEVMTGVPESYRPRGDPQEGSSIIIERSSELRRIQDKQLDMFAPSRKRRADDTTMRNNRPRKRLKQTSDRLSNRSALDLAGGDPYRTFPWVNQFAVADRPERFSKPLSHSFSPCSLTMALDHPVFFLLLRDPQTLEETFRRRAQGFPDEDEDAVYTSCHRTFIMECINGVFQDGIMANFPRLPALLAPGVSRAAFQTTMSPAGLRLRVLFLWRELAPEEQLRFNAQYAIAFHIASRPPYSAVHLAHTMLRFTYVAIRTYILHHYDFNMDRQPKLKSFAYQLDTVSAYGLAFFDNIHDVYRQAVAQVHLYPRFEAMALSGLPVSTWPPFAADLLCESTILRTYYKAASFCRI
ncbi:hypothetical protein NUW54_g2705 [Trametes sanguinea]|uniref:Uncharacterized protein n=1 Tax=Trametes sanguinea TaxID=158606 RepID=A0ACC1Q3C9_9APHY|nr:hypothetical protein NUW54_g2705 [Trametes sanguinea]